MKFVLPAALVVGSIHSAMQQPIFPGKIVVWFLCVLSIVSWVLIVSKSLQLARTKKADKRFGDRLRSSKTTLEVFEEGWRDENSLQLLVYQAGARETAFQLLGSRNPGAGAIEQIGVAGKMDTAQREFLESAFDAGYRRAERRLVAGTGALRIVAAGAFLLGLLGAVWTLMDGFDNATDAGIPATTVGTALGFFAISLLVAIPAVIARISFSILLEPRRYELRKFRDDIVRLFLRKFAGPIEKVRTSVPRRSPQTITPPADEEEAIEPDDVAEPPSSTGKKRYHSIRDRLLDPLPDSENDVDMNPIARQAATLRPKN